jgi:hypothetical protein
VEPATRETLERWEGSGGVWRVAATRPGEAEVELLSCDGEPMGRVHSADPALIDYLARRPTSEEPELG